MNHFVKTSFVVLLVMAMSCSFSFAQEKEEAKIIVELTLKGKMFEKGTQFDFMAERQVTLRSLCAKIRRFAEDDNVAGIIVKPEQYMAGMAQLEELIVAFRDFKKSGKKIYFYSSGYDVRNLMLASVADEVWIMPDSIVMVSGLQMESMFFKGFLEKIGIEFEVVTAGEFKSAGEPYTRDAHSPESRKALESLLNSLYDNISKVIAENKKLKPEDVKKIMNNGPYISEDAIKTGLIDKAGYYSDFRNHVKKNHDKKTIISSDYGIPRRMPINLWNIFFQLANPTAQRLPEGDKIAVIYAEGIIHEGESQQSLLGMDSVGSDTIVKALSEAFYDDDVKAVVLRIDSPGGSAVASDIIHERLKAFAKRKPLIISMGSIAASGGYYIACAGDKIFAEPSTVTGSIGVITLKPNIKNMLEKIGVTVDVVSVGKGGGMFSVSKKYTPQEMAFIKKYISKTYKSFVEKVANGRKLKFEDVEKNARGRVWTGAQAKKIGLVDEIGGLMDAIIFAKKKVGIKEDEKVFLKILPRSQKGLFDMMGGNVQADAKLLKMGINIIPEEYKPIFEMLKGMTKFNKTDNLYLMPHIYKVK